MPQDHSHDYTPKGPQYSEENLKGMAWLMLLLAPFMLITSCFKLACSNDSQARADAAAQSLTASVSPTDPSPETSPSSPELPPPSPPADL